MTDFSDSEIVVDDSDGRGSISSSGSEVEAVGKVECLSLISMEAVASVVNAFCKRIRLFKDIDTKSEFHFASPTTLGANCTIERNCQRSGNSRHSAIMTSRCASLLSLLMILTLGISLVIRSSTAAPPLDDQLPDTTGLFFGKRAFHPNMNNLLFGKRSYAQQPTPEEALYICKSVKATCARMGLDD